MAPVVPAVPDPAAGPDEVLPQEVRTATRHTRRAPPTRRIQPGDRICGECGEGNPATRKFCSRCGESLTSAAVAKPRWWQRLRPRRGPKTVSAAKRPTAAKRGGGQRSLGKRVFIRVRRYGFVVVLLCGVLTAAYPPLRTVVVGKIGEVRTSVSNLFGGAVLDPVRPAAVHATTTQTQAHPAKAAFDGFKNTYWAAPWGTDVKQPAVTVDLGEATVLGKVIVTSGAADDFVGHNRPSILVFTYSNEKSDTITLRDTPEPQEIALRNGLAAEVVDIQVLQVFETKGASDVALTEIEFFGAG